MRFKTLEAGGGRATGASGIPPVQPCESQLEFFGPIQGQQCEVVGVATVFAKPGRGPRRPERMFSRGIHSQYRRTNIPLGSLRKGRISQPPPSDLARPALNGTTVPLQTMNRA